jgi:fumarate reductase subunit D
MFNFWTMFADGPMLSAIYSIYVLLVLLIVSIVAGNAGASAALGWVGVAVIATLILVVLIVKCIVLEHMDATLKSMKIEGVSEYYLVYINSKPLSSV